MLNLTDDFDFLGPIIALFFPVLVFITIIWFCFDKQHKLEMTCKPYTIQSISKPFSTGGIGSVLMSEVFTNEGLRVVTYTDWINGLNVGSIIAINNDNEVCISLMRRVRNEAPNN